MSDQAPSVETPEEQLAPEGTPSEQHDQPDTTAQQNWEDRYKEAQAWGTRAAQEAAQYRQVIEGLYSEDPAVRQAAAETLGLEIQQEQQQDGQQYLTREEWEAYQAEQQAALQQDEVVTYVEQYTQGQLDSLQGFNDAQKAWILRAAVSLPPVESPEGVPVPDIASAVKDFEAFIGSEKQAWAQTKRAPRPPAAGSSATEAPNLDDREQRRDWMLRRLEEAD
jgi:hypothetical protein